MAPSNKIPDYKPIELTDELRQKLIDSLPYSIKAEEIKNDRELRLRCFFGDTFESVRNMYPQLFEE